MGYDRSWVLMNKSDHGPSQAVSRALELGNASAGPMVWQGGNVSEAGAAESEEHGEEQGYRHFTTTVQVVIFVGSLLESQNILTWKGPTRIIASDSWSYT